MWRKNAISGLRRAKPKRLTVTEPVTEIWKRTPDRRALSYFRYIFDREEKAFPSPEFAPMIVLSV
jgi:hypothetical protein